MAPQFTLGISVHTGWGACVVVAGSLPRPQVIASEIVELLAKPERFCFHVAAEMRLEAAERWLARVRARALGNARRGLAPLMARVSACAIVAKDGEAGSLATALASHPRIHTAEGCFYRDVFREACAVAVRIVPPASLDASKVGKLAPPPWGRDQKLATLAACAAWAEHVP